MRVEDNLDTCFMMLDSCEVDVVAAGIGLTKEMKRRYVDYVELYNNSDKTFDLSSLMLGVVKESFPNPADTTLKEITADSRLFLPQSYVLLSSNSEIVGQQYGCPTDNYVQMASFPGYANAGGTAILMGRDGTVVDEMRFSEKMH